MSDNRPSLDILLIEDSPPDVALTEEMLSACSEFECNIVCANTLQDGVKLAKEKSPSLVLLDLSLPDSVGVENINRIKSEKPNTPVVVLSGAIDDETALQAIHVGADDFLVKGQVSSWQLSRSIRHAIDRRRLYGEFEHMSHYDALTGLPNRKLLSIQIGNALKKAIDHSEKLALLSVDLDFFKPINDDLGFETGDIVLQEAAQRLLQTVHDADIVARWGGDEFIVLLPKILVDRDAEVMAKHVIRALADPFKPDDKLVCLTASIGIAVFPGDGTTGEALISNSNSAMYLAKNMGRNCFAYHTPGYDKDHYVN